ncbi:GPI ethanolamine phosphate transferase 2 [Centruroides vittatus]|uniref:GPI ethanolamine phosphate transferase 2 n=1 Tax=Centruroides vittatus TaxID=120091 RepID=UPI003510B6D8
MDKSKINNFGLSFLIIVTVLLNAVCMYLFLTGFLPIKTVTTGYATLQDVPDYKILSLQRKDGVYKRSVDKLAFIVVDALRADFVPSVKSGFFDGVTMPYVESLIRGERALRFVGRCHSPTVTLPRIKSMLTGSLQSFVDLIFNLNAKSLDEDSFVFQASKHSKTMVFYGDDTWLRLFPNRFARSEGTTSFFVSDYTEVDKNVTGHLELELSSLDWDVLFLHYLGVDHIGHLVGPDSPLLPPKLQEMDSVIEMIHKALKQRKRNSSLPDLIVVTGDHGMSIGGNHGGVSRLEVSVPVIILSTDEEKISQFENEVFQIDMASTLSILYGVPIPKNNYGRVMKDIMNMTKMTMEQQLFALYYNSLQLNYLLESNEELIHKPTMIEPFHLHRKWISLNDNKAPAEELNTLANQIIQKYVAYMERAREILTNSATKYNVAVLIVAIIIGWQTAISLWGYIATFSKDNLLICYSVDFSLKELAMVFVSLLFLYVLDRISSESVIFHSWNALLVSVTFICSSLLFMKSLSVLKKVSLIASILSSETNIFLVLGTALYVISLLSSSFIEEEHQTWYFITISYFIICLYSTFETPEECDEFKCHCQLSCYVSARDSSNKTELPLYNKSMTSNKVFDYEFVKNRKFVASLALIVLNRILRSWNQTGNKWAHLSDIGDYLNLLENKLVLTTVVILAIIFVVLLIVRNRESLQSYFLTVCILCVYFYRVCSGQLAFFVKIDKCDQNYLIKVVYVILLATITIKYLTYLCKSYQGDIDNYVVEKWKLLRCLVHCWIVFSIVLHRPHNIMIVACVILQEKLVAKLLATKSIESITIVYMWMAMCAFFYQGNSNSLSTIDVSAGYLGISSYHPVLVGILIASNTYSGIVFWLLMLVFRIHQRLALLKCGCGSGRLPRDMQKCASTLLCVRYLSFALYLVTMLIQRYHLFVWTVFTPKLLYESAHNVVFSLFSIFMLLFSYQKIEQ